MADNTLFTVRNSADAVSIDDERLDDAAAEYGRRSRFGLYLRYHAYLFRSGSSLTTDRAAFALAAFMCATKPIMEQPYIAQHGRVLRARPRRDTAGRRLLTVDIATPTPAELIVRIPFVARGWQRTETDEFGPPTDCDEPTAYTQLTIGLPAPIDLLPDPNYEDDRTPDVATARQAVRALANYANVVCNDLLGGFE